MSKKPAKIEDLRQEIDKIDEQLLSLIKDRLQLAKQVGKVKEKTTQNKQVQYLNPERQAEILRRVSDYAKNNPHMHIKEEQLCGIFNDIISLCLSSEVETKVVYLGPEGTFTQQAALKYFGKSANITPEHSIFAVFREVEAGNSRYGVVPIENSSEGMVSNTMDVLVNSPLKIVGEVKIPVHHCLLSHPWSSSLEEIKTVISHQQSIGQCHIWLTEHLPNVEIRVENSNARAAQITKQMPGAAAIGSELNVKIYGLNNIASNIEDHPNNTTRFFIIGDQETDKTGSDKTSIVVGAKNEPGSLYKLLECFYKERIDLNLLESHPTRMGDWQYNFFIDFYGHRKDEKVAHTLTELKQKASFLKVLGSYPCSPQN